MKHVVYADITVPPARVVALIATDEADYAAQLERYKQQFLASITFKPHRTPDGKRLEMFELSADWQKS